MLAVYISIILLLLCLVEKHLKKSPIIIIMDEIWVLW